MADYGGRTYEFVSKAELKLAKKRIDEIIRELQKSMKKEYGITFEPILVGSAKRHLVTRVKNGNTGFDFDYNFSLQIIFIMLIDAKRLKNLFMKELNKILAETSYKKVKNKTQAMTIKFVDKSKSEIIHSCDFAIINDYKDKNDDNFQKILIYNKKENKYIWNKRPFGKNYGYKLSNILENVLWTEVKEEYLNLKNCNNDSNKISFSLYLEAVNNVYNRQP